MTARQQHRLRPRPGKWVRWGARGQGKNPCDLCGRDHRQGWGFLDAGQITTVSAIVCDDCARGVTTC
jgi:hypothetical protein